MVDCKNCYHYDFCLAEDVSIAVQASKQGMKASCYKFQCKDVYYKSDTKESEVD